MTKKYSVQSHGNSRTAHGRSISCRPPRDPTADCSINLVFTQQTGAGGPRPAPHGLANHQSAFLLAHQSEISENLDEPKRVRHSSLPLMGLRSPLLVAALLLVAAAAASKPGAAAFAASPTGPLPLLETRLALELRSRLASLIFPPTLFVALSSVGARSIAGNIVKQLSSVVKWPRVASPHAPKHQPAHSPYGGECLGDSSLHSVWRRLLVEPLLRVWGLFPQRLLRF